MQIFVIRIIGKHRAVRRHARLSHLGGECLEARLAGVRARSRFGPLDWTVGHVAERLHCGHHQDE